MNIIPNIAYQYRKDIERKRKKYIYIKLKRGRKLIPILVTAKRRERKSIPASGEKREREKKLQKVTAQVDQ